LTKCKPPVEFGAEAFIAISIRYLLKMQQRAGSQPAKVSNIENPCRDSRPRLSGRAKLDG
jgi:hypothetical protein